MIKSLVEKIGNKEKIIISIIAIIGSIFGSLSMALLIQSIWTLLMALGLIGSLNLWLDMHDEAKKKYCYEVSDNYFNKNKETINEVQEKYILNKLVMVNKFCTKIQVGLVPSLLVLALLLVTFGVSFPVALMLCGSTYLSTFLVTVPCIGLTDFYIDVLCEVLEKIECNKNELALETKEISTKRNLSSDLLLNPGISKYRYKYVPNNVSSSDIDGIEASEVIIHMKGYSRKVLKRTNIKR